MTQVLNDQTGEVSNVTILQSTVCMVAPDQCARLLALDCHMHAFCLCCPMFIACTTARGCMQIITAGLLASCSTSHPSRLPNVGIFQWCLTSSAPRPYNCCGTGQTKSCRVRPSSSWLFTLPNTQGCHSVVPICLSGLLSLHCTQTQWGSCSINQRLPRALVASVSGSKGELQVKHIHELDAHAAAAVLGSHDANCLAGLQSITVQLHALCQLSHLHFHHLHTCASQLV